RRSGCHCFPNMRRSYCSEQCWRYWYGVRPDSSRRCEHHERTDTTDRTKPGDRTRNAADFKVRHNTGDYLAAGGAVDGGRFRNRNALADSCPGARRPECRPAYRRHRPSHIGAGRVLRRWSVRRRHHRAFPIGGRLSTARPAYDRRRVGRRGDKCRARARSRRSIPNDHAGAGRDYVYRCRVVVGCDRRHRWVVRHPSGHPDLGYAGADVNRLGVLLRGRGIRAPVYTARAARAFAVRTRIAGIRDNEARMRAIGYPVARYVTVGYCIAGAIAGGAGVLWVNLHRFMSPGEMGFELAALTLLAAVIGGGGSMWGACVGAALVVLMRDYVGGFFAGQGMLLLGVMFVIVVYLLPRGISGFTLPKRTSQGVDAT